MRIAIENEWGSLRTVVVARPIHFRETDPVNATQRRFYGSKQAPDVGVLQGEHSEVTELLRSRGIKILSPELDPACPLQFNVRDTAAVVGEKVILARMARPIRRYEPKLLGRLLPPTSLQTLASGTLEGGDVLVTPQEILVGISERTDSTAIAHFRKLVGNNVQVTAVPLADGVLHLDVALSLPAPGIAIVFRPAFRTGLPTALDDWDIIDLDKDEYASQAANVFPLGNGDTLVDARQSRVAQELTKRGLCCIPVALTEITKVGGGLRCMTLALDRSAS